MDTILSRILECMGPQHGAGKELADFLGINPNVITNWKNGSNRSYRKYLKQIAEHYGVTEDYLLTGERKEKAPTQTDGRENITFDDFTYAMHNETKDLPDIDKQLLLSMARQLNDARRQKSGEHK